MALVKCPECGEMISDKAAMCIKCGYPIRELGIPDNTEKENNADQATETEEKAAESDQALNGNSISHDNLMEYLKHGIDIAGEVYGLEQISRSFISACEKNKPVLAEKPLPASPAKVPTKDAKNMSIVWIVFGAIAIGAGVIMQSSTGSKGGSSFFDNLFGGFMDVLAWIVIILGAGLILMGIGGWIKAKGVSTSNSDAIKRYEDQKQRIIAENKKIQEKYNSDRVKWLESKMKGCKYLEGKVKEIEKVSDEYFSADIVYPKYRSLVALSTFYEYLSSGRCQELTGKDGCYNLFESESRQDIIITQLDRIIDNLEQIRRNQYILYEELKRTTSALNQISSDLSVIRDLTVELTEIASLNLYYNSVTAANTSALAFLATIRQ